MSIAVLEDIYPSRVEDRPHVTSRQDPVLWPHDHHRNTGPLSAEQLEQFAAQGFLLLADCFTPQEVQTLLEAITALGRSREIQESAACIYEPSSGTVRSLFNIHRLGGEIFHRLIADQRIAGAAMQILGSAVYIHQSRVNLKPAFRGESFYWHSDFETWHVEDGMPRMRALSCSLLLTDNNPFNGPLMLVPGSHLKYVSCVGRTPEDHYKHSLRKQEYGVPDAESLTELIRQGSLAAPTGRAGSVLLFDCNVMHGSSGNISPWPRSNLFCVYNSVANVLQEPFGGMAPRPEFIAARQVRPIVPVKRFTTA